MPTANSAALAGLYQPKEASYRSLQSSDVKKLVSVLRDQPTIPDNAYWAKIKKEIHNLPSHLRSHSIRTSLGIFKDEDPATRVKPGKLCSTHHGLKAESMYDLWDWLHHEIDRRIGPFLWPVIINAGLPPALELQVRQLEPVAQMYHHHFHISAQTPDGREPILPYVHNNGEHIPKWMYQENKCPACLLARVGADKDVLFALLVGMVGRFSRRALGKKNEPRSSRIRWVRYWLKAHPDGAKAVDKAWDLGMEVKRLHKAYKVKRESAGADFYGRQRGQTDAVPVFLDKRRGSVCSMATVGTNRGSRIGVDISEGYQPGFQSAAPPPPQGDAASTRSTRSSAVGIDISDPFTPIPNPMSRHDSILTQSTIHPPHPSSIYSQRTAPLSPYPPAPSRIFSLASGVSTLGPEPEPFTRPDQGWWDEDNNSEASESDDEAIGESDLTRLIPKPLTPKPKGPVQEAPRQSMYGGFGQGRYDDVSPPGTPTTEGEYWRKYRGARSGNGEAPRPEASRRENGGEQIGRLADLVERELRGRDVPDVGGRTTTRSSRMTEWGDLY
ncbi:hypothetical protein P154DRAFT_580703 [Amniculicola lignicola CBS 123094]|uniref:Uncharacterized protein n=1 Tax=Amniculicola lignicola CBS 123094 TaxID=1392246 RepID=A0A6A5W139_9PLEO|nr:hypothetical protein P154DRAFT_580703 [Amniculicola lignicola CBS 123094]